MADFDKVAVEKLDVNNFATWSVKMRALLVHKGLWTPVSTGGGGANSDKALALLTLYVADHHLSSVAACETAKDAWDALESTYKAKSKARRLQLKQELNFIKLGRDEPITKYVARAKNIRDELLAAGHDITEEEVVWSVLAGLPDAYKTIKTIIMNMEAELYVDTIMPMLLKEEQESRPLHEDEHKRGTTAAFMGREGPNFRCWYCQKTGHTQAHCRKRKLDGDQRRKNTSTGMAAMAF
jgi:gag-polypeptide of LTR copia-type/Domain of unknown function (DUF4219)